MADDGFQVVTSRRPKSKTSKVKSTPSNVSSKSRKVSPQASTNTPTVESRSNKTYQSKVKPKFVQNSLRVTKLPSSITQDDLLTHFQQVCPVDSVKMGKYNSAFINFSSYSKGKVLFYFISSC